MKQLLIKFPWQRYYLLGLLGVLLLPVTLAALAAYKLLEFAPAERYRTTAGGVLAAGILLLAAVNFSPAGPAFVTVQTGKFIHGTVRNSVAEMKAILFHTPVQPEPKKPFNWRYAGLVAGSSLGWGLTAGGLLALLRRRERGGGLSVELGKSRLTRQEKKALQKVAEMQHPAGGFLIGVEKRTGMPVALTYEELNLHALAVGGSGTGKTTLFYNVSESVAQHRMPLFYLDGKGDPEVIEKHEWLARKYDKKLKVFSFHREDSWHYDPLGRGGITELKDKLLHLKDWGEGSEHWEVTAGRYLQMVFRIFEAIGQRPDLLAVSKYLHPDDLAVLVRKMNNSKDKEEILGVLETYKTEYILGLWARLATLTESEIGHLFKREGNVIDLNESILNDDIVVFSLDSLGFPDFARYLGRLIVLNLKGAAAAAYRRERKPVFCIFDEFNVYASPAVVDLIGKARGAGFHALIATQSLADIEAVGGKAMMKQIVANCATFIVQRQNDPEDAQLFADVVGTVLDIEVTRQVQHVAGIALPTGMGTVKEVDRYPVHPNIIKNLGRGEAVLIRKAIKTVQEVRIRKPAV
jgi:hypothetical protein